MRSNTIQRTGKSAVSILLFDKAWADMLDRWFFKSTLSPEEVILIKCFDSKKDGRARRVPHTAFHIPGTEDKEGRESIEVRALVFHENDSLE